jgi:hypothetical protein
MSDPRHTETPYNEQVIASFKEDLVNEKINRIPSTEREDRRSQEGETPFGGWRPKGKLKRLAPREISNEVHKLFEKPEDATPEIREEGNKFLMETYGTKYTPELGMSVFKTGKEEGQGTYVGPDQLASEFVEWRMRKETEAREAEASQAKKDSKGRYVDDLDIAGVGNRNWKIGARNQRSDAVREGAFYDESNPVFDNGPELAKIWADPNAGVVYMYGKTPEEDKLVFVSNTLIKRKPEDRGKPLSDKEKNKKGQMAILVSDFNTALVQTGLPRREIRRPVNGDKDTAILDNLQTLNIGTSTFKGEGFAVDYPKESEMGIQATREKLMEKVAKRNAKNKERRPLDRNAVNLDINEASLEKYAPTPQEAAIIEDVLGLLGHANKEGDEIPWLGLELSPDKRKITGFVIVEKAVAAPGGEVFGGWKNRVVIPPHIFRAIFKNVSMNADGSLEFRAPNGERLTISPQDDIDHVMEVMSRFKFDGNSVPDKTKFFIGDKYQK